MCSSSSAKKHDQPATARQVNLIKATFTRARDANIHLTVGEAGVLLYWWRNGTKRGDQRSQDERRQAFRRLIESYPVGSSWDWENDVFTVLDYTAEYRWEASPHNDLRLVCRSQEGKRVVLSPSGLTPHKTEVRPRKTLLQRVFSF